MPADSRVAVLVETSTSWGAQLVTGIGNYARENGPWLLFIEPRGRYEKLRIPKGWKGDGVIARVTTEALAEQIIDTGLPAVNLSWYDYGGNLIPRCTADEDRSAKLAAKHFLERGFEHFAYCGPLNRHGYTDLLCDIFASEIRAAGHDCSRFQLRTSQPGRMSWDAHLHGLVAWLKELPRPVGLLTWDDIRGRQVTEACRYAQIRVPEEVAVLGGERDELMGSLSTPPLSSIDHSPRTIGHTAAKILDQMMSGSSAPKGPVLIGAKEVIVRESTDILAIDDDVLADAIGFIRQRAHEGIHVDDVLERIAISRRMLEQRFMDVLGRSPAAEIRRVKIDKAKRLLTNTDLTIKRVATASGFGEPEALARVFRREVGVAPSAYRKASQET